ncbi:MAG TPA: phytanoyl-CoA dioxygenase family protein [Candidatus Dormibacteraeota bacterium]|nr:phytanoyl-CoA dioxygenase family protein [Candidatus Dormibacteraeota bacterium]
MPPLRSAEIEKFHRDGYLIVRGLIRGEELGGLRAAADRVVADGVAGRGPGHRYRPGADGAPTYWRTDKALWDAEPAWGAVTVNPDLLEAVGQCLGMPFFVMANEALVAKLPGHGAPIPMHQDPPYASLHGEPDPGAYPIPAFTTDIYLDAATRDNGCVWAIPGWHRNGRVDLERFSEEELLGMAQPCEMEPGDVMFHCLGTPHGSPGNQSQDLRRTFYLGFLAEEPWRDFYSRASWSSGFPVWGSPEVAERWQQMLSAREELGFESLRDRPALRFHDTHVEFVGEPRTPPRAWEQPLGWASGREAAGREV